MENLHELRRHLNDYLTDLDDQQCRYHSRIGFLKPLLDELNERIAEKGKTDKFNAKIEKAKKLLAERYPNLFNTDGTMKSEQAAPASSD